MWGQQNFSWPHPLDAVRGPLIEGFLKPRLSRRGKFIMVKLLFILFLFNSCAVLHHVQVGDVIYSSKYTYKPFDIKVSETGVNVREIGGTAAALGKGSSSNTGDAVAGIAAIISILFQMGPRTGNPVFDDTYADRVASVLYDKCPSGLVTGLTSIRETKKYPYISGEIIKVTGYCLVKKKKFKRKKL